MIALAMFRESITEFPTTGLRGLKVIGLHCRVDCYCLVWPFRNKHCGQSQKSENHKKATVESRESVHRQ